MTTPRLRLREVVEADCHFISRLMNEAGYLTNVGDRGVRTSADAAEYIRSAAIYRYERGLGFNLVELGESGEPVGICGLVCRDNCVEIGFGLLDEAAGRGFASEAASATVAHAFGELGLIELVAITNQDNSASRHVLEKLGMSLLDISAPGECTYCLRRESR